MSFWVINNTLYPAFINIDFSLLSIDLSKWWGHYGSTLKIKVMEKLMEKLRKNFYVLNNTEIITILKSILIECGNNNGNYLISPLCRVPFIHINEPFIFWDYDNKILFNIGKLEIQPDYNIFEKNTQLIELTGHGKCKLKKD